MVALVINWLVNTILTAFILDPAFEELKEDFLELLDFIFALGPSFDSLHLFALLNYLRGLCIDGIVRNCSSLGIH